MPAVSHAARHTAATGDRHPCLRCVVEDHHLPVGVTMPLARRPLLSLLLSALCATGLAAVETPLTVAASTGNRTVVIDPAYGTMTMFEVTASNTNRVGLGKTAQPNFLSDAQVRLNSFLDEVDGEPLSWLRLGSQTTKPLYGDMFRAGKWFPDKPTKKELAAGKADLQTRALRAENAFWKGTLAYDGTVAAALSSNGANLMIVLPSLHALLWYKIDGDAITLGGWRNYGPELLMTGYNTTPDPSALLARVPKEKQEEAKAALGLDEDAKTGGETPPAAGTALASEEPPTPKSEAWIGATGVDAFLLVDVANSRAMLYRVGGKTLDLVAVRNLAVDLVVPGLVGGAMASDPMGDKLLESFLKERKKPIAEYGLPATREEIMLLVGQKAAKGKVSPFEALANAGGLATLNFVDKRVLLTLDTRGGQTISLAAARDYTLDLAVALLDEEISHRVSAEQLVANAAQLAKSNKRKSALLTLRQALSLDPRQHKTAEKALKGVFKNEAEMLAQFQTMLDEAAKKTEELEKLAAERRKAMEEKAKAK